ncbi:hypothetical protein R6Q57_025498 [Mikania cordata]
MEMRNWRHTNGTVGNLTKESGDWRAQLHRQSSVNKLTDTLIRHLPFSGYERLQELKNIAVRIEEEIYTAATSQSEYSRKICLNMLMIETRLQNPMSDSFQSNNLCFSVPLDSTAQAGNPNGGDWQEEVYQKVKAMKELYLLDSRPIQGANGSQVTPQVNTQGQQIMSQSVHINTELSGMQGSSSLSFASPPISGLQQPTISTVAGQILNMQSASRAVGNHVMQPGDWRAQLAADSRERIRNKIFDTLKRHLPFTGQEGLQELEKIGGRFEEKIYTIATSQSDYLRRISLKMLTMEIGSHDPMSDLIESISDDGSALQIQEQVYDETSE